MRTMFFEKRLLNDAFQKHDTSFILNGKQWGEGKLERERKRERKEIEWVECGRQSVAEKMLQHGS
jgi:hypothetical protein